jgi:uncharacterized integral membrane protein
MAKTYCILVGAILLIVGIIGFTTKNMMGMEFHLSHNIIHLASGLVLLGAGVAGGGARARTIAMLFGLVYVAIAVAGFAGWSGTIEPYLHLALTRNYNAIHAVVGVLGVVAGFAGKPAEAARRAAA